MAVKKSLSQIVKKSVADAKLPDSQSPVPSAPKKKRGSGNAGRSGL